ncbi:hypothetical protein [Bradyrhizobium sp. DASA03120]|uniref:hypothetical protein n=1 Tax=Bradyrhizobium sp. SMVTL-02 TaxID=3395917 RepID=UPI003F724286
MLTGTESQHPVGGFRIEARFGSANAKFLIAFAIVIVLLPLVAALLEVRRRPATAVGWFVSATIVAVIFAAALL